MTLIRKIAFLVPIHPPHFKYAKGLIDSFRLNGFEGQADLWFVFTNEKEKDEFGEYQNSVVLPEKLRVFDNRGIINIKKFYGLFEIKDKYEYVIVLDAETSFIRNTDLEKICNDYFNAKVLYGNKQLPEGLRRTEPIKNHCKRFFPDSKNLDRINDDLYLWFNQPCIYKTSTLDEFFEVINYKANAAGFTWFDFDYYIYMYYLILYHNFRIEDMEIESNYGVCEAALDYIYFKSNKYETLPIYMCSQATLQKFDNPACFILCHLDRDDIWMMRVTNMKIDNLTTEINDFRRRIDCQNNQFIELGEGLRKENEDLQQQIDIFKVEFTRYKRKNSIQYKLKQIMACFVPSKRMRRKIRGDYD